MRSAQNVYPIIPEDDTSYSFVEFIRTRGSDILSATIGQGAPQVFVSLMEGARSHVAKTGSTVGIFRPDALAAAPGKAKHFFPDFHDPLPQRPPFHQLCGSLGDPHPWRLSGPIPFVRRPGSPHDRRFVLPSHYGRLSASTLLGGLCILIAATAANPCYPSMGVCTRRQREAQPSSISPAGTKTRPRDSRASEDPRPSKTYWQPREPLPRSSRPTH